MDIQAAMRSLEDVAREQERERCAKIVDGRAKLWNEAAKAEAHGDCAMSLAEECEDIARAIRRGCG